MKIIIDTNIIFSALLNTNSVIGEYLLDPISKFQFYSTEFVLDELDKYHDKLLKYSKLTDAQLKTSKVQIFKRLTLISDIAISIDHWNVAYDVLKEIDPKDIPFLATALSLDGIIWTGDKKLIKGLRSKGFKNIVVDTDGLQLL
jgi:putative PIN family toxin of toxin-antitoxin system